VDSQSSVGLKYDPKRMDVLRFASYILPPAQYQTKLLNFPITNCHEPYGTAGEFFLTLNIYQAGERFARVDLPVCNQDGFLEFDFDNLFDLLSPKSPAIMIAQYNHDKDIPVELYLSNTHRASGTYLAYPTLSFMGDVLYPEFHATQLENTLFWPGLPTNEEIEAEMVVVNPYKLNFEYQLSIYLNDQRCSQSPAFSVDAYSARTHILSEVFRDDYASLVAAGGEASVCIGAQYKVVAFMSMRNRVSNIITAMDHLHTYQLV